MRSTRYVVICVVAAAVIAACDQGPPLHIELVAPGIAAIDPTRDSRLSSLALLDDRTGALLAESRFSSKDTQVTLERLPLGFHGNLRVRLQDSSERLLGLGRALDVGIGASGGNVASSNTIRFNVRKPIAYLGGDRGIEVLDTTQQNADMQVGTIEIRGEPRNELRKVTAVAPLGRGTSVLLATENPPELWVLDTSTNTPSRLSGVTGVVRRIVVDPTDRNALLFSNLGMAPFAIQSWPQEPPPEVVALEGDSRSLGVFGADGSVYVVEDAYSGNCSVRSSLRPQAGAKSVALSAAISDITTHPDTGFPVVASICSGTVYSINPDTGVETLLFNLPSVSHLARVGRFIVAFASNRNPSGFLRLHAKVWPDDREVDLTWPRSRFQLSSSDSNTRTVLEIIPGQAQIVDVTVGPDADHAVVSATLSYVSTDPCDIRATTYGYQTVSLRTGSSVSFTVTKIVEQEDSCNRLDSMANPFEIRSGAILFGGS